MANSAAPDLRLRYAHPCGGVALLHKNHDLKLKLKSNFLVRRADFLLGFHHLFRGCSSSTTPNQQAYLSIPIMNSYATLLDQYLEFVFS